MRFLGFVRRIYDPLTSLASWGAGALPVGAHHGYVALMALERVPPLHRADSAG
jgi:hypothetical protein